MDYQYKSICRGENSIYGCLKAQGVDPTKYIFVFNLRSYDRINNTPELKKQEETSGVTYQQLQRAQAEEIMGTGLHGASGEKPKKKGGGKKTAYKCQPTGLKGFAKRNVEQQAESSESESDLDIDTQQQTGERAAERKRRLQERRADVGLADEGKSEDLQSSDSIAKNAMLGEQKVSEENWAGREPGHMDGLNEDEAKDQEKENFIQEQLYIHGKVSDDILAILIRHYTNSSTQLLIVDDRIVICGSSNINDRSQLGFHDSELAIVLEDTFKLGSKMDGHEYTAGHHAATLRRILWREHLGLIPPQSIDADDDVNAQPPDDGHNDYMGGDEWDDFVADPLNDDLWKMWTERATTNTLVFRHLFHADPDDQ